jgi:hypothetical protein
VRDVTDEQRSRWPIFIATLRVGASWPFFRVAHSTRMIQIWALRYRQSGSDRLEKRPTDLRQNTCYFGDRTLGSGFKQITIRGTMARAWRSRSPFAKSILGNTTRATLEVMPMIRSW